jgi:hypothetical protein
VRKQWAPKGLFQLRSDCKKDGCTWLLWLLDFGTDANAGDLISSHVRHAATTDCRKLAKRNLGTFQRHNITLDEIRPAVPKVKRADRYHVL